MKNILESMLNWSNDYRGFDYCDVYRKLYCVKQKNQGNSFPYFINHAVFNQQFKSRAKEFLMLSRKSLHNFLMFLMLVN